MGLAAKMEVQVGIEERVATLETSVGHMRDDVSQIKVDLKSLDAKFERKFDGLAAKFDSKFDHLETKIDGLNSKVETKFDALRDSIAQTKIWMLLMMGAILGILARGFHWI